MKKGKKHLLRGVLAVALLLTGVSLTAQVVNDVPWKTPEYTLLAREMPLRDALGAFGTAQGLSVILSKNVTGAVSGDFRKMAPRDFLDKLTALSNLIWYFDGSAIYVYATGELETMLLDLRYMKADEVRGMLKELGMEDTRFPLKTTSNDELLMVAGPPRYVELVSELVAKADKLREKRAISEIETRIFLLRHTWADDVNLSASGAEGGGQIKGVAKMLEEILGSRENIRVRENGLRKDGDEKSAATEDDLLADMMNKGVRPVIKAENRLNAVIVKDVSSRMPLYEQLIKELDVPQKLVEIAVTVVEMSRDDALDWQLSLSVRGGSSNMDGAAGQNAGNLFSPDDLIGKGVDGALTYVGKHVSVAASLSALRQKGRARSISRTSILTMNNMSATMADSQSYHARVVGTEVASLQEVTAGMKLSVKPRLVLATEPKQPNQFWMTISLEDGGFESIAVDSMPLTRSSTVQTQTAVYEGEDILLGGYLRDIEQKVGWGIPFLRDIPYIGWLFGGVSKKTETVQRMFILTPYVVELDIEELARMQATRQRDIRDEEKLEDDLKEDESLREIRDLEREDREDARKKKLADELKVRKGELKLEKEKREAVREETLDIRLEELEKRREDWEQEQKKLNEERDNR